ncbi:MAG: butyrate kinase [Rikenellaceae bacterium]|nr:butyrate kinase [Rikenellaceae bacterium]
MPYKILAINPGSTSTKVAVYNDTELITEIKVDHTTQELARFDTVADQMDYRKRLITDALSEKGISADGFDAIIGRGGLLKPIPSGVYEIDGAMLDDLRSAHYGAHASNLGALIAESLAGGTAARAFIADPVVVDEMDEIAKLTGLAGIRRRSVFHALNQKAIARSFAARQGVPYESLNLIVAHLGGGISVGAHRRGRVVDVNNALDGDGPFSPERAGRIPAASLARMVASGHNTWEDISKKLAGKGGLVALLGTNDVREAIDRAEAGDKTASLALNAMCYNIAKEIGAMAAVLCGEVDAVILTGGIAHNAEVCQKVGDRCRFIAPVVPMPGENELEALASNALGVLNGTLEPMRYGES